MFLEEFPSGLFYHVRVLTKHLSTAGLECFEQGRGLLASWGWGSSQSSLEWFQPIGMLSMGSGKGCCLLGLGDCLGAGEGKVPAAGCSSMGEVFCGRASGGDRGLLQ